MNGFALIFALLAGILALAFSLWSLSISMGVRRDYRRLMKEWKEEDERNATK